MDRQHGQADRVAVDEVARQREKRRAAFRDQLALARTTEPEQDRTIQSLVHASPGQQRLRTVAQLEAFLLKH